MCGKELCFAELIWLSRVPRREGEIREERVRSERVHMGRSKARLDNDEIRTSTGRHIFRDIGEGSPRGLACATVVRMVHAMPLSGLLSAWPWDPTE